MDITIHSIGLGLYQWLSCLIVQLQRVKSNATLYKWTFVCKLQCMCSLPVHTIPTCKLVGFLCSCTDHSNIWSREASHLDPLIILFHLRFTEKTPEMLEKRIIHYRIKICYKISSENSKKKNILFFTSQKGHRWVESWSGVTYAREISLFQRKNIVITLQHWSKYIRFRKEMTKMLFS